MAERSGVGSSLTRRDVVKGAVAAAVGAGSVLGGGSAAASSGPGARTRRPGRHRVAIIGAGAGGVAAAYFLAGTHRVDLFEARSKIGGHCDSHRIDYRGRHLTVDLGAQFFHPNTHPIYVTLLEELGLYDPAHPHAGDTLRAPASLTIFPASGGPSVFASPHALATPHRAIEFAQYAEHARQAVLSDLSWETTVESWIRSAPVSTAFKNEAAYPWTTALIGSPRRDASRASARSILQTFALSFSADIAKGATTYNSRIGLQGNLQRLLDRSPQVQLQLSTAVRGLTRTRAGWLLQTAAGQRGPYQAVVLNAPPHSGRQLLRPLHRFAGVTDLLNTYEYFDSRLMIHTDPAYVARDRNEWAVYNAEVNGHQCEGSVWYGALRSRLASGGPIDVFKSWAARRRADPTRVLIQRGFKHPVINRSAIEAARALRPHQGREGLYFSGVYTTGFDSQESAIHSGMKVAESLAPRSRTLASLKARLAANGLSGVSYDL